MTTVLMPSSPPWPSTPPATSSGTMSLDLSNLPPLVEPAPPSNTLLITNLTNPAIFTPPSLRAIRAHIATEAGGDRVIHAFSPLKSLRRIIVSFTSIEPAVQLRQALDGTDLLGCRARLYFGEPTPLDTSPTHLKAPESDKQFFISPPPSPPHGWTMRNEEPPNKEAHAADLASALAQVEARRQPDGAVRPTAAAVRPADDAATKAQRGEDTEMRDATEDEDAEMDGEYPRRKGSTVVYMPSTHGGSPGLPAVMVEDTTQEGLQLETDRRIMEHTVRPPVELMD